MPGIIVINAKMLLGKRRRRDQRFFPRQWGTCHDGGFDRKGNQRGGSHKRARFFLNEGAAIGFKGGLRVFRFVAAQPRVCKFSNPLKDYSVWASVRSRFKSV